MRGPLHTPSSGPAKIDPTWEVEVTDPMTAAWTSDSYEGYRVVVIEGDDEDAEGSRSGGTITRRTRSVTLHYPAQLEVRERIAW